MIDYERFVSIAIQNQICFNIIIAHSIVPTTKNFQHVLNFLSLIPLFIRWGSQTALVRKKSQKSKKKFYFFSKKKFYVVLYK